MLHTCQPALFPHACLTCCPLQATGASNYYLDVHGPPGSDRPAARIWLLDSMNRFCPPLMFGWGCVAQDTLAWLNATSAGLPPVPSLAFVHIPIPQVGGGCQRRMRGRCIHSCLKRRVLQPCLPRRCLLLLGHAWYNVAIATCCTSVLLPDPPQFKEAWYDAPTVGRKEEDVACSVRDTGLFNLARRASAGPV